MFNIPFLNKTTKRDIHYIFHDYFFLMSDWERLFFRAIVVSLVITGFIFSFLLINSGTEHYQKLGLLIFLIFLHAIFSSRFARKEINESNLSQTVVNGADFLTPEAKNIIFSALEEARLTNTSFLLKLLEGLLKEKNIKDSLVRLDISPNDFYEIFKTVISEKEQQNFFIDNQQQMIKLVKLSLEKAIHLSKKAISPECLFLATFNEEKLFPVLTFFNLQSEDLMNAFVLSSMPAPRQELIKGIGDLLRMKTIYTRKFRANRSWTSRPTPCLDYYSIDATLLAQQRRIGVLIGHEKEYQTMINILTRETKNNVLLIGENHSGKSTIATYLALKISQDEVPFKLFDKRLIVLSSVTMINTGTVDAIEVHERLNRIVKEIITAGNIILFLPDIHNLKLITQVGGLSALEVLKPLFSSGLCQIIASTTPEDYRRFIETDSEIKELFENIRVEEVSVEEAVRILSFEALFLERKFKVIISYKAIKRAVMLAKRFLRGKLLPSSAEDLLKEALNFVVLKKQKVLTENDIVNLVSTKTKIPLESLQEEEKEKLLNLEALIHRRLIDQEEAVRVVASALRHYRTGLSRAAGPIAAFLFVGPTGVGKTELAKTLARIYFGAESKMIRFDMSEFQDRRSIFRFIGSPEGEIKGVLTEAVKANPFSLILLDEFEKAYGDVLNLFLAVFDEGRLTDNFGNLIDFTQTIIIATSNALSDFIKKEVERGVEFEKLKSDLKNKLGDFFRPELLNRFDDVVVFRPLSPEHLNQIAELHLKELADNLLKNKGVRLIFEKEVIKKISQLGYNPVYGARPLRAVIRNFITEDLTKKLLGEEIKKGEELRISLRDGKINITKLTS